MFPETTGVGVEFQLPKTSKRIDVLLSGFNSEDQREVLIVELKQWATADRTPMDGVVETFVGGALRNVSHPSYQAWSYAQLLTDFALIVTMKILTSRPAHSFTIWLINWLKSTLWHTEKADFYRS